MDPAARLNIDEAIVNIGAEKIDELPDSTAAKERTLVSVIDTDVNEQHVTVTLRFSCITFLVTMLKWYVCNMDLRGWESLWKTLLTIGVANLLFFFIIVFVFVIGNPIVILIFIAIESACYLGVLIVRRHIRQLMR
jgi:hypothetical protein